MEFLDQTITVTVTFLQVAIYLGIGLLLDWIIATVSRRMAKESNDPDQDVHGITATLMLVPAWPFALVGIIVAGLMRKED